MGLTGRLLMMNVVFLATTVPSPSIVHVVLAIVVCVRLFFSRCKSPSREGILGCYTATAYFPRSCIASRLLLYVRGAAVCIFSLSLSLPPRHFPFRFVLFSSYRLLYQSTKLLLLLTVSPVSFQALLTSSSPLRI